MMTDYDIIVVGAGPAGSTAARYAASNGARVLMLEKDRDVGYPVRCGEAVNRDGVAQFITPDPKWIASTIKKFRLIAPNGKSVLPKLEGIGYVLERRIFDYELAKLAANAGAEVITKAYVYDLLREDGKIVGVRSLIKDKKIDIRSKIIIGADGVESRIGKMAGIDTTCHIKDMESCAQMTLSGVDVEDDVLDFYFGGKVSPGGYLWVFPKGKDTINVGLGLSVDLAKKKSAIQYLKEFVESNFPNAAMLTHIAGGVPCAKTNPEIVRDNVIIVGDAAHQVNPVTGGGIITGMIGGMIGGEVAAESIMSEDIAHLKEYAKRWQKRLGWRHDVFYNIRKAMENFDDGTYDNMIENSLKLPEEKRTIGGVFRTAMWKQPSMLLELAKVYVS